VIALVGLVIFEARRTSGVRGAVRTYSALLVAANRQDLAAARSLCTRRYLQTHDLRPAAEGGLVGLPRNVPHQNFRAWQHGQEVWLCPTHGRGPVYQFVRQGEAWRFDGPIGLLLPNGEVVPIDELEDHQGDRP
jgi:hypothetical protein